MSAKKKNKQIKNSSTASAISTAAKDQLRFARLAQHLIDIMPLGVVVFDNELNITDSNSLAQQMLSDHSDIAQALTHISAIPSGSTWSQQLHQALASGEAHTFENINCSRDGDNYILNIICTCLTEETVDSQDDNRMQIGGILLIEDVTSRVMIQQDLAAAERLAAVGKLAARVAHELNNPLDGILRYINLALRVSESNGQVQVSQYLEESRKGLLRMVRIIGELLEYSRSTHSAYEETNVNNIVQDAVKAMGSQASDSKVEVTCAFGNDMPKIRAGNLFQVFCNLIKNAVDAMDTGGKLVIQTGCDSDNLVLSFADTGGGLSDEVEQKLFEPFFTTKEAGKGTGLGLSICKDIIERYNGQILARNRSAGGSVFTVTIPLAYTKFSYKQDKPSLE